MLLTGIFDNSKTCAEPALGKGAILKVLQPFFRSLVLVGDIDYGLDINFLKSTYFTDYIITNPPFSLFDKFVEKAKISSHKFAFICNIDVLGAYRRFDAGTWENLKYVYVFNRQVDYRGPIYEDGSFHVGGMVSGWFVWDDTYHKNYFETRVMDVQKYATRGALK